MKKHEKWHILLLFLVPALPLLVFTFLNREPPCANVVHVSIGANYSEAQSASLQRLSREISRCPKAQIFEVERTGGLLSKHKWQVTYDRPKGLLYDRYVNEDYKIEEWHGVTDKTINAVSSQSGKFASLASQGCKIVNP